MISEEMSLRQRLDAVEGALKAAVLERDALKRQVTELTLRLKAHHETQQGVNAERNLLRSENIKLHEEISHLREQLRRLRNPICPRP